MARQISTTQNKTANPATAPARSTLCEFPAVTAKRKSRLAGLLYSSILTPHSGYRHADNIIAGRSLTGHAIAL
jgi:hypothetical protein